MAIKITVNGENASIEGDAESVNGSINIAGRDMIVNSRRVVKVVKEVLLECAYCGTTRKKGNGTEVKCKSCGASSFRKKNAK